MEDLSLCFTLKKPVLSLRLSFSFFHLKDLNNNGGVERGNRTFREEFYSRRDLQAESVRAINAELQIAVHKYNTYRPHANLNMLTPMQYIQSSYLEVD